MNTESARPGSRAIVLPLILLLAAAAFRFAKLKGLVTVDVLENFSPWMALAFTGTLVFPKRMPFFFVPALLIAIGLIATGWEKVVQWEAVAVYGSFAAAAWFAGRWRGQIGLVGGLVGSIICTIAFYLVTNTVSWLADPAYTMNFSSWLQALTAGIGTPGLPPTWWFLRQSLLSDLAFSCLLLAAYNTEASFRRQQTIPLLRPAVA